MSSGEFGPEIRNAASSVVVVLTQSWCPQWAAMRTWLELIPRSAELAVFWIEYDREPCLDEFMTFKETALGNDQVPYVRYYRDGVLAKTSNFISRQGFMQYAGLPG